MTFPRIRVLILSTIRTVVLIILPLWPFPSPATVLIRGSLLPQHQLQPQSFAGTLVAADATHLTIAPDDQDQRQVRHIPIASIESLSWTAADSASPKQSLASLARTDSIWPLFDPPSFERVLIALETLMEQSDWQDGYFVANRLLQENLSPDHRLRAQVLSAWSLLEMGMLAASDAELARSIESIPAIQAPLRLCWLAARIAIKTGNPDSARRWAALPFLQIPTASGPLADDLKALGL